MYSAICTEKNEEHIVFAVDHMISTGMGQFEHPISKYQQVNKNTVAMLAWDALLMEYFMDLKKYDSKYSKIQKEIENKFKEKRKEMIKKNILDTFFVDFDFIERALNEPIKNPITDSLLKKVIDTKLNSAALLIGFDENRAKISEIGDDGIFNYRKINFHTIGSGAIQAQNTLLFQNHSIKDHLNLTIYNVYKAKKNAEVMQGVGQNTEIGYLNQKGVKMLDSENIKIFDKIYNQELTYGKQHEDLEKLSLWLGFFSNICVKEVWRMFQEKIEEIEFVSNKRRNEFIKEVHKALDEKKIFNRKGL